MSEPHTGAMLALIPSVEDAARLAVDGGEPAGELHVTIAYLGKAEQLDASARQQLIAATTSAVQGMPVVDGNAFGLASFGQGGDEPCNVLNVGGEMLDAAHHFLTEFVPLPVSAEQHAPWAAHLTLEYTADLARLAGYADRLGPIRFDRVRLAIGGENVDIPLLPGDGQAAEDDGYTAWLAGQGLAEADTHPGGDGQLKRYWLGKGLDKWATDPHPWTALYRHLRKYIKNVDKLKRTVSAWYRDHFGHMPNQKHPTLAESVYLRDTGHPISCSSGGRTAVQLVESGALLDVDSDDFTDAEPLDDAELALLTALNELDGDALVEVFDPSQARYPKGHPMGGRFRPMADRIKDSIAAHRRGEHGDKHPLDGYSREQLRKVAKARGITLKRGEDRDSIAQKLLDDHGKADTKAKPNTPTAKPAPTAPAKPADKPTTASERKQTVRDAYSNLASHGDYVWLADLRDATKGKLTDSEFDQAILGLDRDADIHVVPKSDQLALTARQRRAAVNIGNQDQHLLSIAKA